MELNSDNLTFDQIVCRMADGHELVKDDLGDWLFSGVGWTILSEGTIRELEREGVVIQFSVTDLRSDGAFEERYRLTNKGLKMAGLVSPMVTVKGHDLSLASPELMVVFWIIGSICLAVLVTYFFLSR